MGGKKNQIHVVKNPNGGWSNKKPHAERSLSIHETQQSAINHAIRQAKTQGNTEVIIHSKNGKIRSSSTYTRKNDPRSIRG
ncbi:hypothetical protein MBCUT_15890 [Methanobrevibacter cuticularis]|uniref:DUF2188 domain-containing protein n=1 Tax=Methanobrevibacter cuticularis TaxID=47311 RepID=A0A166D6U2_9EURY|nr:DUF2188 domain-containing protein [Methanobrevibacter cuticularis]KZX15264.1 hypothetical protein MBCUT_15890 [Methanobrevibacter cuticularis]